MKTKIEHIFYIVFALASVAILSCDDDPNEPGVKITSVSPASGHGGTQVIISGENFSETGSENVVAFNGSTASVVSASQTELAVIVPYEATTGKITVSVNGSTASSATDFTILDSVYIDVRIKEIQESNGGKTSFFYNSNNVLTSAKVYALDEVSNLPVLEREITYAYDASSLLERYVDANVLSNQNIKVDFIRSGSNLVERKSSSASVQNGIVGTYQLLTSVLFTYQNSGLPATSTVKNGSGIIISQNTFTYSVTPDQEAKEFAHYSPTSGQSYDVTRIFHKNIPDPQPMTDPHNDIFLMKTYTNSLNSAFNFNTTFETDADGKITKVISTYPFAPAKNSTRTFLYEPRQ